MKSDSDKAMEAAGTCFWALVGLGFAIAAVVCWYRGDIPMATYNLVASLWFRLAAC